MKINIKKTKAMVVSRNGGERVNVLNAFKRFICSFLMIHVSHPYRTTGHTSVLTNLFLRSTLILLVNSSFLLLNASFAIPILVSIAILRYIIIVAILYLYN